MSSTYYYFLPSLRLGLATNIEQLAGSEQRAQFGVVLKATGRIKGSSGDPSKSSASQPVQLYGPGDILGFDSRIVCRTDPKADVGDFEPNFFPAIEFADPDFAWRFTVKQADDDSGELDPWIALIVLVSEARGDDVRPEFTQGGRAERHLARSIIVKDVSSLPDLAQAWHWAHVQITGEEGMSEEEVIESIRLEPELAVSRLMCPRRLRPNTRYDAFVVPTTKLGVQAGLYGKLEAETTALERAWTGGESDLQLPYYYRWQFRTSERGDFERLVRLLEARKLSGLGIRDIDCVKPGFGITGVDRDRLEIPEKHYLGMEGALRSVDLLYTPWGQDLVELNVAETTGITGIDIRLKPSGTEVLVEWQTPVPSSGRVEFGETDTYGQTVVESELENDHTLSLERLVPRSTYHFKIVAQMEDGSTEVTLDGTFTLPTPHPAQIPALQTSVAELINKRNDDLAAGAVYDGTKLPSVVPHIYGKWHRARMSVEAGNQADWLDVLNLDPRHRASSGLGSQVIRNQQEALMASAWEQLGPIESANDILRRAQFGRDVSIAIHQRLGQMPTGNLLRLASPVLKRTMAEPKNLPNIVARSEEDGSDDFSSMTSAHLLRTQSRIPTAALDPAFRRIGRVRGPIRKRRLRNPPDQEPVERPDLLTRLATGELEPAGPPPNPMGTTRLCDISHRVLDTVSAPEGPIVFEPPSSGGGPGSGVSVSGLIAVTSPTPFKPLDASVDTGTSVSGETSTTVPDDVDPGLRFCEEGIDSQKLGEFLEKDPPPYGDVEGVPNLEEVGEIVKATLEGWLKPKTKDEEYRGWVRAAEDVEEFKGMVVSALDPERTVVGRVKRRLRLASDLALRFDEEAKGDALDPIFWAPEFSQPMYEPLRDISHDLLLPGVEKIPQNTLGLLGTNRRFMEAYMCGCNHEFAGELLWRRYPTDQRGSYFRQFWDVSEYVPRPDEVDEDGKLLESRREELRDIKQLHEWNGNLLGKNGVTPGPDARLVLVVRGDLLKRYPNALIYAIDAAVDKNGNIVPALSDFVAEDEDKVKPRIFPIFRAALPPDLTFFGFPFDKDDAESAGDFLGKFFVIEERVSESRFGLDVPVEEPSRPNNWDDLSWSHFELGNIEDIGKFLDEVTALSETNSPNVNGSAGKVWDDTASSATRAWITLQKPVRIAVHADQMIPEEP